MKRRLTTLSVLCAFLVTAAVDFGPPTGSRFPVLNLPDQNGQAHTLRSLLGTKGAAILVYRSSGDCSFCKAQLAELEQHREAFRKLGVGVTAVPGDSPAISKVFAGHAPHPGWFVLDARGVIAAKYFEEDADQGYTSADILVHQFGWISPEAAKEVDGKQLTATIGASNSTVVPGERVALTLDIELQPNMHVYAPGVEGYIPIDWKMEDSPTAEVHAAVFPRAEKLYLRAIDETVPAFRNHFRLTRDITVKPASDSSGHFTVDGTLRYQACDDRVCYIPQTLHLEWDFESKR